jgi:hypothetical protein
MGLGALIYGIIAYTPVPSWISSGVDEVSDLFSSEEEDDMMEDVGSELSTRAMH